MKADRGAETDRRPLTVGVVVSVDWKLNIGGCGLISRECKNILDIFWMVFWLALDFELARVQEMSESFTTSNHVPVPGACCSECNA